MSLAALASLLPRAALACSVCFGKDEALALGLNWGIGILLSFTCLTTGGIAWAVVRIEKSRRALDEQPPVPAAAAQVPAACAEPETADCAPLS